MKTLKFSPLLGAGILACMLLMPALHAEEPTDETAAPLSYEQLEIELKNSKAAFDKSNSDRKSKERELRKTWESDEGTELIATYDSTRKVLEEKRLVFRESEAMAEYRDAMIKATENRTQQVINALMSQPEYATQMEKIPALEIELQKLYEQSSEMDYERYKSERLARYYRAVRDDINRHAEEAKARDFRSKNDLLRKEIQNMRHELYQIHVKLAEEEIKLSGYDNMPGYREADSALSDARKAFERAVEDHPDLQETKQAYNQAKSARDTSWKAALEADESYMTLKNESDALYKVFKAHEKDMKERDESL